MAAITVASHTVVRGVGISEAAPGFTSVLKSLYDLRDTTEPIEPSRVLSGLLLGLRPPGVILRR